MAALTNYAENKLIDFLFRAQALGFAGGSAAAGTGPTNLYIGLFTTNPSDDAGTGAVEVSGNAYARVNLATAGATVWDNTQQAGGATVSSGTTGTTRNQGVITFATPTPSGWGIVTGVGIFDHLTNSFATSCLIYAALTASKTINSGDAVTFPANSLTFQLDN